MYWPNYYTWTDDQESSAALRAAGWSLQEIARLRHLRRVYHHYPDQQDQSQPSPDLAHLLFIRWLVAQGKLSDQLDDRHFLRQEEEQCQQSSSTLFGVAEQSSPVLHMEMQGISWWRHKLQALRMIIARYME